MKESPIFVKTYDMLVWLLKHTRNFPRDQRFVMAKRMEEAGLGLYDELLLACQPGARRRALVAADHHLARLKNYSRLCFDLRLQTLGQHEHLARNLEEIGRLLGGWLRKAQAVRSA